MRRAWVATIVLALSWAALPAGAGLPGVPRSARELVAEQRGGRSNAVFAQIVMPGVKGYDWSVIAHKPGPKRKTILQMSFTRSRAQATQSQASIFKWELARSALKMDANLKPASLVTGDGMGNNGSISMKLTDSIEYKRFRAPEGCTGSVSYRIGRFGGRFRFNARDQYFKRISVQGAQVFLYREHDYRCDESLSPAGPCPPDLWLSVPGTEGGAVIGAFKTREGKVDQAIGVSRPSGAAESFHYISVTLAVPEAFEASDDLTSANLDGDAAGPWLSGDLSYVGPPGVDGVDDSCGPYRSSDGFVTGDYTAHFDSIGDVTPASTGLTARLRRDI